MIAAADVLANAGYEVSAGTVDVSSRESVEALVLERFRDDVARGGAGVVIASQCGHRLPRLTVEQNRALATTPVEELLGLPFLQADRETGSLHAYQLSKRGNALRVQAEAVRWGRRGARVDTISPGIIITPLARDELTGPRGGDFRAPTSPPERGWRSWTRGSWTRCCRGTTPSAVGCGSPTAASGPTARAPTRSPGTRSWAS